MGGSMMVTKKLYTQLEVIELLKLPPTTIKRWLEYFTHFIPVVQRGDSKFFEYESLKVLTRVSELRQDRYHLGTIVRILVEEGFPMYSTPREMSGPHMDKPGSSADSEELKSREQQRRIVSSILLIADELYRLAGHLDELGHK
ncbi:MerR family transcriptional regulator [Paenibacillus tritici]|uniref:MerR family transcriptional regulator n=1 Tax=Paenibacillus tritici TaxID=1873425 RepID=UPI001BA8382E|nr:MerR family transcriptional regulator [Paenibacillus tritici]QUL53274.1 MerR family transcriptional regulator [Paenibacillus tritici]